MNPDDRELLVEQAASAYRQRAADGRVQNHPAWYDLDAGGRQQAFDAALVARQLEAALDPDGLSTTGRAVLARLSGVL
jgi:hypothetical protein